jgi:hypothetical protein
MTTLQSTLSGPVPKALDRPSWWSIDQRHSDSQHYLSLEEHGLEVTTFTAWRASESAPPVLYSIMDTLFMVAFGTLREKETSLTALRARYRAVESFGILAVDQSYLPANDSISINNVAGRYDTFMVI